MTTSTHTFHRYTPPNTTASIYPHLPSITNSVLTLEPFNLLTFCFLQSSQSLSPSQKRSASAELQPLTSLPSAHHTTVPIMPIFIIHQYIHKYDRMAESHTQAKYKHAPDVKTTGINRRHEVDIHLFSLRPPTALRRPAPPGSNSNLREPQMSTVSNHRH